MGLLQIHYVQLFVAVAGFVKQLSSVILGMWFQHLVPPSLWIVKHHWSWRAEMYRILCKGWTSWCFIRTGCQLRFFGVCTGAEEKRKMGGSGRYPLILAGNGHQFSPLAPHPLGRAVDATFSSGPAGCPWVLSYQLRVASHFLDGSTAAAYAPWAVWASR